MLLPKYSFEVTRAEYLARDVKDGSLFVGNLFWGTYIHVCYDLLMHKF